MYDSSGKEVAFTNRFFRGEHAWLGHNRYTIEITVAKRARAALFYTYGGRTLYRRIRYHAPAAVTVFIVYAKTTCRIYQRRRLVSR